MRSLSTKVTKTYDIDITLIWIQLHVILFNFVKILLLEIVNVYSIQFYYSIILSHLLVAGRGFF